MIKVNVGDVIRSYDFKPMVKASKPVASTTDLSETSRLEKIINDHGRRGGDVEDFNQILRVNGFEV